ncbi:MAG: DUF5024 domain-containing protein [Tannerella sp.]|jgi:uncharacterized membrane-anchored protein|nr:DUF5024 domain-containing protein [Tannerella sp.]
MKTSQLIVVLVLLVAGCFSMDLSAQETLKALVKKCENMENVNVNIVRNKDKTTRKVSKVITSISFSNNEVLVKEILAAFNKDKDMADQEIENRSNGRVNNLFYRFGSVSYSFSEDGNGSGSLSVIGKGDE